MAPGASASGSVTPPIMTAPGLPTNLASALCYIVPVICPIIFLVVDPYKTDKIIRFAALQSLFLTLSFVVINGVVGILASGSDSLAYKMIQLLDLAELVLVCYLAFKAFQNEKVILPGVGPIAQKQV